MLLPLREHRDSLLRHYLQSLFFQLYDNFPFCEHLYCGLIEPANIIIIILSAEHNYSYSLWVSNYFGEIY